MERTSAPQQPVLHYGSNLEKRWLRRKEAAEYLTNLGYPVSDKTLATMASRGDGPEFRHFGRKVLYEPALLVEWAESRVSHRHPARQLLG